MYFNLFNNYAQHTYIEVDSYFNIGKNLGECNNASAVD